MHGPENLRAFGVRGDLCNRFAYPAHIRMIFAPMRRDENQRTRGVEPFPLRRLLGISMMRDFAKRVDDRVPRDEDILGGARFRPADIARERSVGAKW